MRVKAFPFNVNLQLRALKKSPPETERKIKSKQIAVPGFLSFLIHLLMTHYFGLDYNNYSLK